MTDEALDQLADTFSLSLRLNSEWAIAEASRALAGDIASVLAFEDPGERRHRLARERERYAHRAEIAAPFLEAAAIGAEDEVETLRLRVELARRPCVEPSPVDCLAQAVEGHLAAQFVGRVIEEMPHTQGSVKHVIRAYRSVALTTVREMESFGERQAILSGMESAIDSVVWTLGALDRTELFITEIKHDAALAHSLMRHYRRWINNGADVGIQMKIDEARRVARWQDDENELGVLFMDLLSTPHIMLAVIKEHDPSTYRQLAAGA
jgi:hypothetical protein